MEAGHGGASGRFKRLEDTALNYAFMLEMVIIFDLKAQFKKSRKC